MAAGRLASFVAVLALAASCNRAKTRTIGVVPKATSHLFWVNVEKGVRQAALDKKVELLWNGAPSETDYARQVQIVESMIARRVDGLAVAATEAKILVSAIDRAMAGGIPVVVFDSGVATDNIVSFIATNNYEGGALGARALAKAMGGAGEVALLAHQPGSNSTMERERGFEETLAKEFPKIEIVAHRFSMSDRAKGLAAAENMLAARPKLVGMFASAEPGSVGAAKAIQNRGLGGKVHLVTFDSSEPLVEGCRGGWIDAMVVQDPHRIGYQAVEALVAKLDGASVPKRIDLAPQVNACP
jgi:ribose transport system substrate-binding protein